MTKVELKVFDPHYPEGMIVDVNEEVAEDLIKTGYYKRLVSVSEPVKVVKIDKLKKHGKSYSTEK